MSSGIKRLREEVTKTWISLAISGVALRQILQKGVSLTKTVPKHLRALVFLPLSHIFEGKVEIGGLSMKIYTILMVKAVQLSFNK